MKRWIFRFFLTVLFVVCCLFCSVSAIDFDNEWHEPEQVGIGFANIPQANFSSFLDTSSVGVFDVVNVPYIREVRQGLNAIPAYNGFFITIPLRGDLWQVDASKGFEVRFVCSTQDTFFQECYASRIYYDALPVNVGDYYRLWTGDWIVSTTRFKGVTSEELVTQAYINGGYQNLPATDSMLDIETYVQTQPLFDDAGCIYNFYINPNVLPNWARSITFFIGTNQSAAQRRFCINSVGVRNYNIQDELSVQKSILSTVQELASRQGMSADQVSNAVVEAFEQIRQEEQNEGDQIVGELDATVDEIVGDLHLDSIQESLDNIGGLFNFNSDFDALIVDIPRVSIPLGGRSFVAFPGVTWNITKAVNDMLFTARQTYDEFDQVINICGYVIAISITLGCIKIIIGAFLYAFDPQQKTITVLHKHQVTEGGKEVE